MSILLSIKFLNIKFQKNYVNNIIQLSNINIYIFLMANFILKFFKALGNGR